MKFNIPFAMRAFRFKDYEKFVCVLLLNPDHFNRALAELKEYSQGVCSAENILATALPPLE